MRDRREKDVFVFLLHVYFEKFLLLRDVNEDNNLEHFFVDIHSLIDIGINIIFNANLFAVLFHHRALAS